jgi:hypothetical protein
MINITIFTLALFPMQKSPRSDAKCDWFIVMIMAVVSDPVMGRANVRFKLIFLGAIPDVANRETLCFIYGSLRRETQAPGLELCIYLADWQGLMAPGEAPTPTNKITINCRL